MGGCWGGALPFAELGGDAVVVPLQEVPEGLDNVAVREIPHVVEGGDVLDLARAEGTQLADYEDHRAKLWRMNWRGIRARRSGRRKAGPGRPVH